ncbi:GNAT family N-acetyltransferase [Natronomonas sp. F2-12]|jgi:ribosomal protein S18 acetylase RimI-like enzyme|uniref:GNAT family N-acetyltransferase n=1 Tax=Natronomonas aquatica TaxID=2841590 RepID=A0A9R1D539_9EURY|nr:GNAT family N-acetyltransferase [Natronomonas aquatica]MCQ4331963.1 GNAT family N-acetyltransferase [Natronomonas aquatica]
MTIEVEIRPAETADIEAITDVAEAVWYAAYGGMLDPSTIAAAIEEYYDPELLGTAVELEEIAFYVAAGDGVVGFASAERTWADEAELHTIYVHPDRWGEGIGSALLGEVTAWARERDVDRIACGVLADNAVGIGFFEAVGFERGRETDAEIAGEIHPEYEYELPL